MKRNRWKISIILGLTVCSTTLLTSCSPLLNQVDTALQDLQIWLMVWLKDHNPFDTSITTKFVGIGLSDFEPLFFPKPETLVAYAFPEESTECTGNPKNLATLPLRSVSPQFRKCVAEIAQKTQVPILLPTKLPSRWIKELPIYTYARYHSQGYAIGMTLARGEYYQGKIGVIGGKKVTPYTPTLEAMSRAWNMEGRSIVFHHDAEAVVLLGRIPAYYFPPICGANCHTAYGRVIWEQNGYQYWISIRMGRQEEVVEAANSAIANQL